MIQKESVLWVADNSGAKELQCIHIVGSTRKRYAYLGDIIVCAVKKAIPGGTVKKGDVVKVLSGKDKGKQGEVIQVLPAAGKVLVKNIAVVTKHVKARKQGDVSAI